MIHVPFMLPDRNVKVKRDEFFAENYENFKYERLKSVNIIFRVSELSERKTLFQ